jgi:hypothetical protein
LLVEGRPTSVVRAPRQDGIELRRSGVLGAIGLTDSERRLPFVEIDGREGESGPQLEAIARASGKTQASDQEPG